MLKGPRRFLWAFLCVWDAMGAFQYAYRQDFWPTALCAVAALYAFQRVLRLMPKSVRQP